MICTRCGRASDSAVCVACTARLSQGALEGIIQLIDQALRFTGRMKVVCCVCQVEYGSKPCLPEMDGETSHGYCTQCFADLKEKGVL